MWKAMPLEHTSYQRHQHRRKTERAPKVEKHGKGRSTEEDEDAMTRCHSFWEEAVFEPVCVQMALTCVADGRSLNKWCLGSLVGLPGTSNTLSGVEIIQR